MGSGPQLHHSKEEVRIGRPSRREDVKQRWTRGADVEDASTTGTRFCTIHR